MAGIYIHIPFCKKACHYCNFHFSTSLKNRNDFVQALLKEIEWQKEYLQHEPVETIYFGGGTPSLLPDAELREIMEKIYRTFDVNGNAEITLEANPDDISREKIKVWKKTGISRLSLGIQSFFDKDLQWMNRAHNADQGITSIHTILDEGMNNLSVDLIYGTPGLTDKNWEKNIERVIALNIPHLSCYALTVEPNTALNTMILHKKTENINPDDQARQFLLLMQWMGKSGYEHYEISNFALPGKRSRHNSAYWQGKKYLGLGPSAHSYNGISRQWNIANNALYIQSLMNNNLLFEKEVLTNIQRLNEYIMTSLRTTEGIDLRYLSEKFDLATRTAIETNAAHYIKDLKLLKEDLRLKLTNEGKLFADGIAASLFFE
ncbi:MAG TPA: radical SAM family heme chaperone HemW [Puia sp.]|nr:radical SAM family heme chaperone HemW [Puia sp.]